MIHKTAIIDKSAKISKNVIIGPYTIIGPGTEIATGTQIGSSCMIESAAIGENCKISSHAAIGTPPQDLKYKNEKTRITIGDNCNIREFTTLNRGTAAHKETVIGSNCLLMAYVHVAHDCIVGDNVIMANAATLGGHVEIGERAFVGGMVAIHQFVRIGKFAMLGGGAMVSLDILPFSQAQGDRARLVGLNIVGLKRNRFSAKSIEDIKSAYKILFLSGLPVEEAIDQLEATDPKTEVRNILEFIHSSKRGICRPLRKDITEEI